MALDHQTGKPLKKPADKVVLYHKETGEPKEFYPVDAREQLAHKKCEYTTVNPKTGEDNGVVQALGRPPIPDPSVVAGGEETVQQIMDDREKREEEEAKQDEDVAKPNSTSKVKAKTKKG